jgi:hypothetical protein
VTSEVAVAEAVAGYRREVDRQTAALTKIAQGWGRLGAAGDEASTLEAIAARASEYAGVLAESLEAAQVEVLPTPDVAHMDVVARSLARMPPCDSNGNGYRDTLIWLTFLALAAEEEELVLVTNDSDFMDESKDGFHPDLIAELERIGARDRAQLVQVLADVIVERADRSADKLDLKELRSELKDKSVRAFVESLLADVADTELDARACALPRSAQRNFVQDIGPMKDFKYSIKGGVREDEAVAEFSFRANTRIVVALPEGEAPEHYEATLPMPATGEALYVIVKQLRYRGVLTLGRYGKPLSGEISRIAAKATDPGHASWRSRAEDWRTSSDVLKNLNWSNPTLELLKKLQGTSPAAEAFKNLPTQSSALSELLKKLQGTSPTAEAFKNLPTQSSALTDLLRNLQSMPRSGDSGRDDPAERQTDEPTPAEDEEAGEAGDSSATDSEPADEADGEGRHSGGED